MNAFVTQMLDLYCKTQPNISNNGCRNHSGGETGEMHRRLVLQVSDQGIVVTEHGFSVISDGSL